MKLELAEFPVKHLLLGRRFSYRDQTLEVDEGELLDLARRDPRLCDVALARLTGRQYAYQRPQPGTRALKAKTVFEYRVRRAGRC